MRINEETFKKLPPNLRVLFDKLPNPGSEEVLAVFPNTKSGKDQNPAKTSNSGFTGNGIRTEDVNYGDSGSAARFFYCAKASKKDRDEGLEELEEVRRGSMQGCIDNGTFLTGSGNKRDPVGRNTHPTVKPTSLMQYLCRLITPPNGLILDPFCGSGSTGKAAVLEGFRFVGIDKEKEYCEIAEKRIKHTLNQRK